MTARAYLVAARRSAVAPRNGALSRLEVDALAAPVVGAVLADAGVTGEAVDEVLLGNALYGGGNPARRVALLAGLPEAVPALTLDRQCASGLDAILLAARLIESGRAHCVLAGGVESYSRAPIRMTRPLEAGDAPRAYDRPPFTPWPERDPDMDAAAADLAARLGIDQEAQIAWTVDSHARARRAEAEQRFAAELVPVAGATRDAFARDLDPRTCARSPVLARCGETALRAATAAVAADAAAVVCVVSDTWLARHGAAHAVRIVDGVSAGGDPTLPGLAPVAAGRALAARTGVDLAAVALCEVMEAYAVQAIACVTRLGLDPDRVNRSGGALARGHPIGASGAILAVRAFHELAQAPRGAQALAAIASAGGLGTAALFERV
ncbi:thiolase family protein [Stappia sp.]|uniref:thiolase family protein n=1 Tax=Stappia sp. TaxID=1870903 RepID=UPI0032D8DB16